MTADNIERLFSTLTVQDAIAIVRSGDIAKINLVTTGHPILMFADMRPTTLAAIIADLSAMDTLDLLTIKSIAGAYAELVANCGEAEAHRYLSDADVDYALLFGEVAA